MKEYWWKNSFKRQNLIKTHAKWARMLKKRSSTPKISLFQCAKTFFLRFLGKGTMENYKKDTPSTKKYILSSVHLPESICKSKKVSFTTKNPLKLAQSFKLPTILNNSDTINHKFLTYWIENSIKPPKKRPKSMALCEFALFCCRKFIHWSAKVEKMIQYAVEIHLNHFQQPKMFKTFQSYVQNIPSRRSWQSHLNVSIFKVSKHTEQKTTAPKKLPKFVFGNESK